MPKPKHHEYDHLQRHKTRHGKFNWYVQIGAGPLVRVKPGYGEVGFKDAYDAALQKARTPTTESIAPDKGTLQWAWLRYKQSAAWAALSKATRRQRENIMEGPVKLRTEPPRDGARNVLAGAGKEPLSRINADAIRAGLERRKETPFAARNFLETMRGLMLWLKAEKHIRVDPTEGVTAKRPKTRGFPEWTDADIVMYEKRWPLGTRQRVALDVYCFTGLRRGDAAMVGPQHVYNGTITLPTEKSQGRTVVHIPILDALQATLGAGPTGSRSFICKEDGEPYVKESLGNLFKEWCVEAGVMGKSAHGLRKAAATRAADSGATAHELMAIFGWLDIKEAELYTRRADRKRLAKGSIHRLQKVRPNEEISFTRQEA